MSTDGRARRRARSRGALSDGPRREPQRRAVDALAQPRRDDRGRRDRARLGRGGAARAAGRARPADLRRRRSSRRTPRWPSCSTAWSASTRRSRAGSACTTSTAGSARSPSRSRRARASCGGSSCVEQAVADAIAGARRNGITNAHFFAGDTRLALPELLARAGRPDVVVVDPPRAGLSKKVVHRIIDASPRRIVYVSCNPTTLAPNAAELVAGRLGAAQGAPGGHVPPDPPHRVRRAVRARTRRSRLPGIRRHGQASSRRSCSEGASSISLDRHRRQGRVRGAGDGARARPEPRRGDRRRRASATTEHLHRATEELYHDSAPDAAPVHRRRGADQRARATVRLDRGGGVLLACSTPVNALMRIVCAVTAPATRESEDQAMLGMPQRDPAAGA